MKGFITGLASVLHGTYHLLVQKTSLSAGCKLCSRAGMGANDRGVVLPTDFRDPSFMGLLCSANLSTIESAGRPPPTSWPPVRPIDQHATQRPLPTAHCILSVFESNTNLGRKHGEWLRPEGPSLSSVAWRSLRAYILGGSLRSLFRGEAEGGTGVSGWRLSPGLPMYD